MSLDSSLLEKFILDGSKCKYPAGLYIVGTPIGNLEDITLRALATLHKADLVACEDTRVTRTLLSVYGITAQLVTYNDTNGDRYDHVKTALKDGKRVALVSDAGMPLISDPGYKLVEYAIENDIYITCIPGPSAPLTALTLSGLPSHEFTFKGFFPKKEQEAKLEFQNLLSDHTYIYFESLNRLKTTMERMIQADTIETVVIARELTKNFESVVRGTPQEISEALETMPLKGEMVLIFHTKHHEISLEHYDSEILERLKTQTVKTLVDDYKDKVGCSKKELYDHILTLKKGKNSV